MWIRKKCYIRKTSLFGFPNVWKTLIKDICVWSCEYADDSNKIGVFLRSCECADDCKKILAMLLLNLKITNVVKISRDRLKNNVLFIVMDVLYIL